MTTTTLPTNVSDQTLLDQEARLAIETKIAVRERLLALMSTPGTPMKHILVLIKALEKMEDSGIKLRKINLTATRQELRARQLALDEARLQLRIRALDLREAEYQRKRDAAEAREAARKEKAARQAERIANRKRKPSPEISQIAKLPASDFAPTGEPAELASPIHDNEDGINARKAA